MFERLIERFAQRAPVAAMARGLLAHALAAEELDALFREHAERQYEGELLFSSVVELLSLVAPRRRSRCTPPIRRTMRSWPFRWPPFTTSWPAWNCR